MSSSSTGSAKKKLARKQADEVDQRMDMNPGGIYNIWYHKTLGDYSSWKERRETKLAGKRYKCVPARDSGETKAKNDTHFCLYFARGKCVNGPNCSFLHRIPTEADERRIGLGVDAFGRERHRSDREDMGGVGSFERNNKTLYIGGLKLKPGVNMEEVIRRHFGQFGEIDLLNLIPSKSIAFVRYKLRLCAEFAKEAMADQNMDGEEILNVRWANADPNPVAQERDQIDTLVQAADAVQTKYPELWNQEMAMMNGQYPVTDPQFAAYYSYYGMDPSAYYQYLNPSAESAAPVDADSNSQDSDSSASKKRKREDGPDQNEDDVKGTQPEDAKKSKTTDSETTPVDEPTAADYANMANAYYYYYGYYPGYQNPDVSSNSSS